MLRIFAVFVIFLVEKCQSEVESPIVFYDLKTGEPYGPPITTIIPYSEDPSFNMSSIVNIRLPFIGQPCGCYDYQCGCCAGMSMEQFNINQRMCMNFTYDPYEFAIMMDMNMNENSVYSNMFSGKNPSPLCLPVPTGPIPLGMEMCVKLFNIFTPGYNLHMCMDVLAQIQSSPMIILHFDCMRFGRDGPALLKPEENGGLEPIDEGSTGEEGGMEETMVVYDPLPPEEDIRKKNKTNFNKN
ncbi:unnamed protein product [Chironomus riparius]|uniref:DUF4773 domain-containing protein n=1 Tax=Chironomus riparius TaxID=315576 RepID=A0A9N9WSF6_9DIPT|nr:unnamed protein product [Chironomus riparius]